MDEKYMLNEEDLAEVGGGIGILMGVQRGKADPANNKTADLKNNNAGGGVQLLNGAQTGPDLGSARGSRLSGGPGSSSGWA